MYLLDQLQSMMNTGKRDTVEHQFASFVMRHYPEMNVITIQDIAQACHTSLSTISRIVQRMGYESYRDFRLECLDMADATVDPRAVSRYMRSKPLTPSNARDYLEETLIPLLEQISESDLKKNVRMALSYSAIYVWGFYNTEYAVYDTEPIYGSRDVYSPFYERTGQFEFHGHSPDDNDRRQCPASG